MIIWCGTGRQQDAWFWDGHVRGRDPGPAARVPVEVLRGYGTSQEQTRTDHLRQVAKYLGWRPAKLLELKELDEFLPARAMEHDSPSLLFRLGASICGRRR